MPKGAHLSSEVKRLIYRLVMHSELSKDAIYDLLFDCGAETTPIITKSYFTKFCSKLERASNDELCHLLEQSHRQGNPGKQSRLSRSEVDGLLNIVKQNRCSSLHALVRLFAEEFYEDISVSGLWKVLHRNQFTQKIISRKNCQVNLEEQLEFLEDMSYVNLSFLVDFDGMVQNKEDFHQRYGWAPKGEDAVKMQIVIGTRSFAVLAAYCEFGFLCYEVFETTVTQYEIANFLDHILPTYLWSHNCFIILDNSRNQKTELVIDVLERIVNGNYRYCSKYSPELKPIERGFSLVKRYIRNNESKAELDPVAIIVEAFEACSVGGLHSSSCYNHFEIYRKIFQQTQEICKSTAEMDQS